MKKIVFILTLLIGSLFSNVRASECYHYHTSKINEIKIENGKPFWIQTVIDPNGISIASRKKYELKNIDIDDLRYISENQTGILISNSKAYYWIIKNPYTFDRIGLIKIIDNEEVTNTFGANVFCIDGNWEHLAYNQYSNETKRIKLKNFPDDASIIGDFGRGNYLLKGNDNVFVYDPENGTIKIIPNLDGSVRFKKANWDYDKHFLYDDDTFYLIDINFDQEEDITKSFKLQGLTTNFTKATFVVDSWMKVFLDFNDGTIWAYDKSTRSDQNGNLLYFIQLKNTTRLNVNSNFITKNNNIYNDIYNIKHNRASISMTDVANPKKLTKEVFGLYNDQQFMYYYKYNDSGDKLYKIPNLPTNCQFFKGVSSYSHRLYSFIANDKMIYYWNESNNKIQKTIEHKSAIKDLKLAYAFDDKLLIENEIIDNIANRKSMEFVGSSVDVISPCDGGKGQISVVVEYNYYFKDNKAVYFYHSKKKTLEKIKDINPKNFTTENFYNVIKNLKPNY